MSQQAIVLGRDEVGVIAERHNEVGVNGPWTERFYLTDCCGATAKGCDGYVGCRACYREIDPALGGTPGIDFVDGKFVDRGVESLDLVETFGDGIPYDEWKARRAS